MIALLRHSWQSLNLEYQRTHNAWQRLQQAQLFFIVIGAHVRLVGKLVLR